MVAVPGGWLAHGVACSFARKRTGLLVSVRGHFSQGSVFIDFRLRVADGCSGSRPWFRLTVLPGLLLPRQMSQ